jgi:hypothetical protein
MSQVNNGGGLLPTSTSPVAAAAASASFPVFSSPSYISAQVAGKHTEGLFEFIIIFFLNNL